MTALTASVEAAQVALKELRGELGRGSRELLKDVDVTLHDARKNLRRVRAAGQGARTRAAGRRRRARPRTRVEGNHGRGPGDDCGA